jgi:membrane protein implicated in regulation of membrane protease activity
MVFVVHGVLAAALAVTVAMKLGRSLPKAIRAHRWRRVAFGLVLSAATIGALVAGFAWVASGRLLTIASWTVLTIHAWLGLVLVPITVLHLLPRRWRLLRPRSPRSGPRPATSPRLTRRQLLTAAVVGARRSRSSLGAARRHARRRRSAVHRIALAPRRRRPTGHDILRRGPHRRSTRRPGGLRVTDGGGVDVRFDLAALRALDERERMAVLDCTSGWALETSWRGIPLAALLRHAGTTSSPRSVVVRSATGWSSSLDPTELDDALLATSVAGRPLPVANGAPCRLVAPNRRGLDWVKWVTEIDVA